MPRISKLPPPAPLTGLELSPLLQGGGTDAGVGVPILAYATQPRGAVAAMRRPMIADLASTAISAPAAGAIRWDNADPASASQIVISTTDADADSLAAALASVTPGGFVYVQGAAEDDDPDSAVRQNLQKWQVSGTTEGTGYIAIAGEIIASSGDMTATDLLELTVQAPNPSPGYDRAIVTVVESEAGVTQIDASLGDYFVTTLTEATEIQVINPNAAATISVRIIQGPGGYALTFPPSFKWRGGTIPAVTAAPEARDRLVITTDDFGATWDADYGSNYL